MVAMDFSLFTHFLLFIVYKCNNFPIFNIIGNTKSFIYEVDGLSDRISLWVTRFGYINESSRWNRCTGSQGKSQHVLREVEKSLYGLKQQGRLWYNQLTEFLLQKGYTKNDVCLCVFIKRSKVGYCIISVYVDDLNIIRNKPDIDEARHHLTTEFGMKDLAKTKIFLGLQLEHLPSGILVHQSTYTQKILKKFNMNMSYPSKTPMVVRSLDLEKEPFIARDEEDKTLGPEFPYLSVIGALMYLANNTLSDIAFAVNLLARYSSAPSKHHWVRVKNVFQYLNDTKDLGLIYKKNGDSSLIGYTDADYLSDPHNGRSQTRFVILKGGTAI
jgi:hypothetical protein